MDQTSPRGRARLRPSSEYPSYNLPLTARWLDDDEMTSFADAARTGLYSPLELAVAFELSRSLALKLYWLAIDPKRFDRRLHQDRTQGTEPLSKHFDRHGVEPRAHTPRSK